MEKMNYKQIALIAVLGLTIILSGIFFVNNRSLKKDLQGEKIKSEALFSEKLMLDKSLVKFKDDLNSMKGKNNQLDKQIEDIKQQLAKKEAEVKKLIADNASYQTLKIKYKELEILKNKLNEELSAQKLAYENLRLQNQSLNDQLAETLFEKEKLFDNNTILKAMAGNNYRIEAVRGKSDKLTIKARRTQKLIVTFDLPNDVGNNINFKLITPEGNEFASKDNKSASIKITENSDNFYASLKEMGKIGTKRVEMFYIPTEKLGKGLYKFDVYDNNTYIGSTQLRLK